MRLGRLHEIGYDNAARYAEVDVQETGALHLFFRQECFAVFQEFAQEELLLVFQMALCFLLFLFVHEEFGHLPDDICQRQDGFVDAGDS